jgi:hypothetical protein
MTNHICGQNAQHVIEGASPIILLSGTEGSAAIIGMRENAGKIEFGTVTVAGTAPNYTLTWVATIHAIQVTGNVVVSAWLPPIDNDGDKEAAASTWDRTIFAVPVGQAYTITKMSISPDVGIGQDTNYMTLTPYNRGTDGNGTTAIITGGMAYTAANAVANNVLTTMGTIAAGGLTAGQSVSIAKSVASSGQAWPGGLVLIEMTRTA